MVWWEISTKLKLPSPHIYSPCLFFPNSSHPNSSASSPEVEQRMRNVGCGQSNSLNLCCSFFLTLFPGSSLGSFTQETCMMQFSVAWSSWTAPAFFMACSPSGIEFFSVRLLSQLRTEKDNKVVPFIFYNPMFILAGN